MDRRDRWLSMMYPRLRLSKELLSDDGLLAVSIDDRELSVLGVLLDEIFGARNRLAYAPWLAEPSGGKEKTGLRAGHEYLLIYHNGDSSSVTREARSSGKLNLEDRWGRYRKGRELTKWAAFHSARIGPVSGTPCAHRLASRCGPSGTMAPKATGAGAATT